MRHDIDYSVEKSLTLAKIENENSVTSTYFVLLTSDFYNVFSKKNVEILQRIRELGHDVGLHFDEAIYPKLSACEIRDAIIREARILSKALEFDVNCVSMHRPSKGVLEANLEIPGLINSYGTKYLKEFKYLSDSRRRWREPVEEIVNSGNYARLHILTHAFWYNDFENSLHDTIKSFIDHACIERYHSMSDNITDISSIISREEIAHE